MTPNILWIIHGDETYGLKRAMLSLVQGLRGAGWIVDILSVHAGETVDALTAEGFHPRMMNLGELPGMQRSQTKAGKLLQAARLWRVQRLMRRHFLAQIRAHRPDAVHVMSVNLLPAVGWAARRAKVPCFWEMTQVLSSRYRWDLNRRIYRWVIRRFNIHPLANSRCTAQSLGPIQPPVDIVYLGVDPVRFDPFRIQSSVRGADMRRSLGIADDAIVLAIAARMDPSKGQALVLQGMLQIQDPRLHLLLIGGDPASPEAERIRSMAAAAGAAERLHFVPFTAEPERYLIIADVAISSGLIPESFGLSTVEAMMLAKPLLVYAFGGPAETVVDGQSGWHIQSPTPEAFRRGIERALNDRSRWTEMGLNARERALRSFSLPVQVETYQRTVLKYLSVPSAKTPETSVYGMK